MSWLEQHPIRHEVKVLTDLDGAWGKPGARRYTTLALKSNRRVRERVINLSRLTGCDFYHLAHAVRRPAVTPRIKNPRRMPSQFRVNNAGWGLADHDLRLRQVAATDGALARGSDDPSSVLGFAPAVALDCLWNGAMSTARVVRGWIKKDRLTSN